MLKYIISFNTSKLLRLCSKYRWRNDTELFLMAFFHNFIIYVPINYITYHVLSSYFYAYPHVIWKDLERPFCLYCYNVFPIFLFYYIIKTMGGRHLESELAVYKRATQFRAKSLIQTEILKRDICMCTTYLSR